MDDFNKIGDNDNIIDDPESSDDNALSNPIASSPPNDPEMAIPTLNQALHESEASTISSNPNPTTTASSSSSSSSRNIQNLTLTTTPAPYPDPSFKSETSSIVPTSARLSIATTHQELRFHPALNASGLDDEDHNGNVSTILDGILANPGWNVARRGARRNSLFSMKSLAPTLPPYEDLRVPQQGGEESGLRQEVIVVGEDGKRGDGNGEGSGGDENTVAAGASNDGDGSRGCGDNGGGINAELESPREHSPSVPEDTETENALSAHYSRIVRTIDSRYTSELERLRQDIATLQQSHAEELALMRNNIDAAYRAVLKNRNREVEKAKESAASRAEELEQEVLKWKGDTENRIALLQREHEIERERMAEEHRLEVERERNAVEDVWERRWRERMDLVEEEAARRVERKDDEWLLFLEANHPEVCRQVREVMMPGDDDVGEGF